MVQSREKIRRGFSNFKANTGVAHPMDKGTLAKRNTGKAPLTDVDNVLWYGHISVGTPAVDFTVDFDTGSSDLFLLGPKCNSTCDGHKVYNPSASSTSMNSGKTFKLAFGDNSTVEGNQFTDTVILAGLKAARQSVGAATNYSDSFALRNFPPDGLMGMAFPQISGFPADPVFQTLVAQGQTDAPVFAFKLSKEASELFIGGVDAQQYVGEINKVNVTDVGFWQVDMNSVNVDGTQVVSDISAVIDTGTSLIIGDPEHVEAVYSSIPGSKDASESVGSGYYTIPCNSTSTVSLTFGGRSYNISPETFKVGMSSAGSSDCIGGLVAQDSAANFWVVGDVFLQNVYTYFDIGNKQVGFANLA